ncbi:hypothetical protein H0H93_011212 [Arthromyces matolae]|nr:hypothetical protein H0H93_011212 [Arthromyces matolae]
MVNKTREPNIYNVNSILRCPDCNEDVKVGTGGTKNLEIHRNSKGCRTKQADQTQKDSQKKSQRTIMTFFQKERPKNPSTVREPPLVHAIPLPAIQPAILSTSQSLTAPGVCADAERLLIRLDSAVETIPMDLPMASSDHCLAPFAGDPKQAITAEPASDDWENILNPMFHAAFGWAREGSFHDLDSLAQRGQYGVDGFREFLWYFVRNRGLKGSLIENKVNMIISAIEHKAGRSKAAGDFSNGDYFDDVVQVIEEETRGDGIIDRIETGVHENSNLAYHPIGNLMEINRRKAGQVRSLQLVKLNNSRKLLGIAVTLEDHKQWILAVASGRVDRVAALVQAGLRNKTGVRGLVREYERAACKLYKPKGYTEDDIMRSIVMLRLGGVLCLYQPLTVSVMSPTVLEVEANISAFRHALPVDKERRIVHQVLMLDEIAVEKRPRWDDRTDMIFGACREHGHCVSLEFSSERELDMFSDALDDGTIHLASEATVGAIGILSDNPREYSARPILISGTCKKETGPEHAVVLRILMTALNNKNSSGNTTFRTISIASDGEAKRGDALTIITMHSMLSSSSPIHPLVSNLELMNFLVGDDNVTADKDFKHVFKRLRNLMMRNKGFLVLDFCITPPILKLHLQSNGVSSARLHSLLNPNLLKEIWSLPSPPSNSSPGFARCREALRLFGLFAYHLVMPYICVDLSLSEQLIHLSTAAHMCLYFYTHNSARTRFMPNQTYVDMMIMIKNVYFSVAKTKIDNPNANFHIILLGTDRLETFFGLIRTAVGTDSNVDMIQLGNRASGLTEVGVILSIHPEWDRGKRRLKLPVITKESGQIDSKVDHINPASCRGDLSVATVNLRTCWILGRQKVVEEIPDSSIAFQRLCSTANIDILSPFGSLLVNQRDVTVDDDDDCSELQGLYLPPSDSHPGTPGSFSTVSQSEAHQSHFVDSHSGDLEDAMAEELPRGSVNAKVKIKGVETTKPKALRERMLYRTHRASTDRLKRVQNLPCFNNSVEGGSFPDIIAFDSNLGGPALRIGNPAAVLVCCEEMTFLSIVQINHLQISGEDCGALPLHLLADDTAKTGFQIL